MRCENGSCEKPATANTVIKYLDGTERSRSFCLDCELESTDVFGDTVESIDTRFFKPEEEVKG